MGAATLNVMVMRGAARTLGEQVTLPGPRIVEAVVDMPGDDVSIGASRVERGLSGGVRVAAQVMPVLLLAEQDVGTLAVRDMVQVRGGQYLVASIVPDGAGAVRVDLWAPGAERAPLPEMQRWR